MSKLAEELDKRMLRRKFNVAVGAMTDAVVGAVRKRDVKTAMAALDEFEAIGKETIKEAVKASVSWGI